MSDREIRSIAPNIDADKFYILRPTAAFSDPPHCTLADLKTVITLDELADMHETMNLQEATIERARRDAEQERQRNARGGRRGRY